MRCDVCGGKQFVPTRYDLGEIEAPAAACALCHALILDEALGRTEDEREAIRRAIQKRREAGAPEATTVPLMRAEPPAPNQSGSFKAGSPVAPTIEHDTGVRKSPKSG